MDEKNKGHKGLIDTINESRSTRLHAASDKVRDASLAKDKKDEEYLKQLHRKEKNPELGMKKIIKKK